MAEVFYTLKGFRREEQLNDYMVGIGTDADLKRIDEAFRQHTNMIVIAYLADRNELLEVRYSPNLENEYTRKSLGEMQDISERNAYWIMKEINSLGLYSSFKHTERQLDDALVNAVPLAPRDAERIVPKAPTKEQIRINAENYKYLCELAQYTDAATISAIKKLCKALLQADVSVVSIYNQQIFYNKAKNLTAADYLQMLQRIKSISKKLKTFLVTEFKSAEDVVTYVNRNFSDPSATGEATKFVINYPFEKLGYEQRKKMLLLFLDGKTKLSFSGFWSHTVKQKNVSAGDVVFNLLITGSEADKIKLLQELEKEQKTFELLNTDDEDFQFIITTIITTTVMKMVNSSAETQAAALINGIEQQNFYFFDDALNKKQYSELDTKKKQITLLNKGHEKIPNIPSRALLIAKSLRGEDVSKKDSTDSEKAEAQYLLQKVSPKTLFNPLDIIVFTAESKIKTEFLSIEKDGTVLLPACMVHILITKSEEAKKWKAIGIGAAFPALAVSTVGLAAAIEAAAVLGIVVSATDVAVDAAFIAANMQGMETDNPEFVKTVNTIAFYYGLARLGYGVAKGLPAVLNKNWLEAFKILEAKATDFVKKLPYYTAKFLNALPNGCQKMVLDNLLVVFANDGKVLFKMNPESIIVEMKLVTNAGDWAVLADLERAKIKVKDLGGKVVEERVQFLKGKDWGTGEIVIKVGTPFKEGKERPAELINQFFERSKELAPCKPKLKAIDRYLKEAEDIYIVAELKNTAFGGWATSQVYKTELEARNALSLLQKFKSHEIGLEIRHYKPKPGVKILIRESIAGPMKETEGIWKGTTYKGGAKQFQFLNRIENVEVAKQFFKEIETVNLK